MFVVNLEGVNPLAPYRKDTVIGAFRTYGQAILFLVFLYRNAGSEMHRTMTLGFDVKIYEDTEFTEEGIYLEGFINRRTNQKDYNSKHCTLAAEIRDLFPGLF
jgi:hypothetical protein